VFPHGCYVVGEVEKVKDFDASANGRFVQVRDKITVSLWLNAGAHAPEVAERAGHSVDVLLRVYAKCLDGQRDVANQRIAGVLTQ
jgi:hypothetical protein